MKKKLSLILCLCFMALGLAACGTDPTTVDYFGMTYDELQSSMEQEVSALVGLTDDNRTYIQSYGSDTAMKLVESWDEATSDVGAYQGLGEFNITKAQKTLTVDQYVEYQNREVIVSYIYTYNYETEQPELTDAVSVVSLLRLQICKQIDAISAATPLASLTTKVCMEKITLSSRL